MWWDGLWEVRVGEDRDGVGEGQRGQQPMRMAVIRCIPVFSLYFLILPNCLISTSFLLPFLVPNVMQEEQITVEVRIDRRVHSRLIGQRGKAIAKVMEQYKVDIKFPRDKGSDIVTIMGLEDNVADAKEDLLSKTDDFVSVAIVVSALCPQLLVWLASPFFLPAAGVWVRK